MFIPESRVIDGPLDPKRLDFMIYLGTPYAPVTKKVSVNCQVPHSPFVGEVKSIGMLFWWLTYIYGSTEQNMLRKSYVRCHLLLMNLKTVNNYRQEMKFVSSYKVTTSQLWSM